MISKGGMWRCAVYVCLCYVFVVVASGGWCSSYNDTSPKCHSRVPLVPIVSLGLVMKRCTIFMDVAICGPHAYS